jgi:pyruvate formate lyase activating enzyme
MLTRKSLKDVLYENTMAAAPELVIDEGDGVLRCVSCGHRCVIAEGDSGICRMRFNRGGELRVPGGYVAGLQVDPVEKKPYFHALPGRDALSFGMLGCNLHCSFCQNWVSSQALKDENAVAYPQMMSAEEMVEIAVQRRAPVVVSTYNEPLITSDWAVQVFKLARERGLKCGYVSNGNASPEVIDFIHPYLDLINVDLKTFDEERYRTLGGNRQNVLDTIQRLKDREFWIEVVTLVVPDFNDTADELKAMAEFIAGVSPDIPWHVTAYHPDYQVSYGRATSAADLDRAYSAGKEAGLRFVYAGNLPGGVGDRENTYCPSCNALLIQRAGYHILDNRMVGNRCPDCQAEIPGMWEDDPPRKTNGGSIPRRIRF